MHRSRPSQTRRKKKICERGLKCPYLNEHQHNEEFDHEEIKPEKKDIGKGHKLGGTASIFKARAPKRAVIAEAVEKRLKETTAQTKNQIQDESEQRESMKVISKKFEEYSQGRRKEREVLIDLSEEF